MNQLQQYIDEGRLIRNAWTGTDAEGRHTACLLAAIAPVCGEEESASVCPAEVMPEWLAHLTPWMDDNGTSGAWPASRRAAVSVMTFNHIKLNIL